MAPHERADAFLKVNHLPLEFVVSERKPTNLWKSSHWPYLLDLAARIRILLPGRFLPA